jgi:hypothetical protein
MALLHQMGALSSYHKSTLVSILAGKKGREGDLDLVPQNINL